jgi:hypothetical protein
MMYPYTFYYACQYVIGTNIIFTLDSGVNEKKVEKRKPKQNVQEYELV